MRSMTSTVYIMTTALTFGLLLLSFGLSSPVIFSSNDDFEYPTASMTTSSSNTGSASHSSTGTIVPTTVNIVTTTAHSASSNTGSASHSSTGTIVPTTVNIVTTTAKPASTTKDNQHSMTSLPPTTLKSSSSAVSMSTSQILASTTNYDGNNGGTTDNHPGSASVVSTNALVTTPKPTGIAALTSSTALASCTADGSCGTCIGNSLCGWCVDTSSCVSGSIYGAALTSTASVACKTNSLSRWIYGTFTNYPNDNFEQHSHDNIGHRQ
jgi:hypothetical protein